MHGKWKPTGASRRKRQDMGYQRTIEEQVAAIWARQGVYLYPWIPPSRRITKDDRTIIIPTGKTGCDAILDIRGSIAYLEIKRTEVDQLDVDDKGLKPHQLQFLAMRYRDGRPVYLLWRCPSGEFLLHGEILHSIYIDRWKRITPADAAPYRVDNLATVWGGT
jgi:hypothetical protein